MSWRLLSERNLPVGAAMIECGSSWRICDVSDVFCAMCGCGKQELLARTDEDRTCFFDTKDMDSFMTALEQAAGDRRTDAFFMRIIPRSGRELWVQAAMAFYCTDGGISYVIAVFTEAYDQKRIEWQNRKRPGFDQLTGMQTFEAFRDEAKRIVSEPEPGMQYFMEYIDINNFPYLNDVYGYKVGNRILQQFAQDCREQTFFLAGCRFYSDFFVMLLKAEDADRFRHLTTGWHERFANEQNNKYPGSSLSVRAGVYLYNPGEVSVDTAVENAIIAWKTARRSFSKEPIFFEQAFREKQFKEQKIIGAFFTSLYQDDFCMYLQPKFRLGDHEVYGAEALARWQLTDGTIVKPDEFIGALEHIGYVMELDFYIFEEVLKAMTRWQTGNKKQIVVSTNFSGLHFENDVEHFLERVRTLIDKYSISPTLIEIEVTESVMVRNMQNLKYGMDRLHDMGFRIAIDDFGTGYSSLSLLMDIPADVVKMDKSFIDNGIEGRRRDLIMEIGKLVRIAGKEIIFEGIETEEQERLLMECGFRNGQGYLCNRPIMVPEFERLYF